MSNRSLQIKLLTKCVFFSLSQSFKKMRSIKMKNNDKQIFLFKINETHALKYYKGTVLTGQILTGTLSLNDSVVYVDKYQRPIFKCTIADIGQVSSTKLTKVSADEIGHKNISLLIFGYLNFEFDTGCYFMNA